MAEAGSPGREGIELGKEVLQRTPELSMLVRAEFVARHGVCDGACGGEAFKPSRTPRSVVRWEDGPRPDQLLCAVGNQHGRDAAPDRCQRQPAALAKKSNGRQRNVLFCIPRAAWAARVESAPCWPGMSAVPARRVSENQRCIIAKRLPIAAQPSACRGLATASGSGEHHTTAGPNRERSMEQKRAIALQETYQTARDVGHAECQLVGGGSRRGNEASATVAPLETHFRQLAMRLDLRWPTLVVEPHDTIGRLRWSAVIEVHCGGEGLKDCGGERR